MDPPVLPVQQATNVATRVKAQRSVQMALINQIQVKQLVLLVQKVKIVKIRLKNPSIVKLEHIVFLVL